MSLTEKVRNIREDPKQKWGKEELPESLRRIEELADKYKDITPKTDMPSPEQYMGLPKFSK